MSRSNLIDNNNTHNYYNRSNTNRMSSSVENLIPEFQQLNVNAPVSAQANTVSRVSNASPRVIVSLNTVATPSVTYSPSVVFTPKEIIDNAFRLFSQGKEQIQKQLSQITNKDAVVLFIGNTGAGKSTLINYLGEANLSAKANGINWEITGSVLPGIDIGNSTTQSATSMPQLWKDQTRSLVYCDLPLFLEKDDLTNI